MILFVLLMTSIVILLAGFKHLVCWMLQKPTNDYEILAAPEKIRTEYKKIEV